MRVFSQWMSEALYLVRSEVEMIGMRGNRRRNKKCLIGKL